MCAAEMLEPRMMLSTVTINAGTTIRTVPSDMVGVNTAPWDPQLSTSQTLSLSQAAGLNTVRIGGGSTADRIHFNSTSYYLSPTSSSSGATASSTSMFGQAALYAASLGASAIVTVDYGEGSPQEAAALLSYLDGSTTNTTSLGSGEQWSVTAQSWEMVNWQTVGYWASLRAAAPLAHDDGLNFLRINHAASFNIQYWEVGNEVYGSWEADEHGATGDVLPMPSGHSPKAHDPTTLISFAKQFASLASGIASGLSIGYDSQAVDNSYGNWITVTLQQCAAQGFTPGFIADHYYTSVSPGSENDATLLGMSNTASSGNTYDWSQRASDYDSLIHQYLGSAGNNVVLFADEVNSIPSSPGKQTTSLVNGLYIADAIGSALATTGSNGLAGYQGFWIWDLHDSGQTNNSSSSLYGWRSEGDYGIVGSGNGYTLGELSPDYFALQLASKIFGPGGTIVSSTEDNESAVDTFAVLEPNGHLDLLVINKTDPRLNGDTATPPNNLPDPSLTETFKISGFNASSQAQLWQYGVVQDDAQATSSNFTASLANSILTLAQSNGGFTVTLPDYSMSVIDIAPLPTLSIAKAAAANPNPVAGTSTTLSALGSENGSGAGLTYTWSYTGPTGVTYSGATNGTNAASSITSNFTLAGNYNFLVTISDTYGQTATSSIAVTVNQTPTSIVVSPSNSPVVPVGFTQQFSATATDQFGHAISSPSFTWGITGSGNSISPSGYATLGSTPGSVTVTATDAVQGSATVIAENFAIPSGSTLDVNLGSAGAVSISASGSNITASQNGVYITLSGFTGVTVTDTASNDVLDFNGPLALPLTFVNTGTSTINVNSGTLTFSVGTIDIGKLFVASGAAATLTPATTSTPSILNVNSFSLGSTAVFDVANNEVLINYGTGPDPITSIAALITSGYNAGSWNGNGIVSSTAQTTGASYGLGYADAADPGNSASLPSGQIEILYTLLGDANLDGLVNGTDFNILAANFNQSITGWDEGDFNYDGLVNAADFNELAANFDQGSIIASVAAVMPATPVASSVLTTPNSASAREADAGLAVGTKLSHKAIHGKQGRKVVRGL